MKPPEFENRWLIQGTLTTESELHIGDGGAGDLRKRDLPAEEKKPDASTVCVDHEGKAYVPGSAIKGPLRALVQDAIRDEARALASSRKAQEEERAGRPPKPATPWSDLLGSDSPDDPASVGGKLEFWDAFHRSGQGTKAEEPDPKHLYLEPDRKRPWWNDTRKTCVVVSVSLDRPTRTAKENLLYHLEYVPKGETFDFEISGENLSVEEVARLLLLLDQFNPSAANRATIGALASNGWGRVTCEVKEICRFDKTALTTWKANPAEPPKPKKINGELQDQVEKEKASLGPLRTRNQLVIDLSLAMESPWLIRDPRQSERSEHGKNLPENNKPRDAVAIRDESGKPFVPAKSLRGALRARAEMILRTLGRPCASHPGDIKPVSTKGRSTGDVLKEIGDKDLAARLFGLSGWRGPLHVPRLVAENDPGKHEQEFVAIDRFTGGAAAGAKFNAELAGMTTLTGKLTVDLDRLAKVDPEFTSLGLLALVLRDLEEGDIPIGSGSAKGQGFCTATIRIDGAPDWRTHTKIVAGLAAFRALVPEEKK